MRASNVYSPSRRIVWSRSCVCCYEQSTLITTTHTTRCVEPGRYWCHTRASGYRQTTGFTNPQGSGIWSCVSCDVRRTCIAMQLLVILPQRPAASSARVMRGEPAAQMRIGSKFITSPAAVPDRSDQLRNWQIPDCYVVTGLGPTLLSTLDATVGYRSSLDGL